LATKSRDSLYLIDSTVVEAHRAASGAKGGEKNQAIGISRGGQTKKIHVIVDSKGRPLGFIVTGGQVQDRQVVEKILNTTRAPLALTADKANDSEKVRQQIRDEGALPVIPNRCTASKKNLLPQALLSAATQNRKLLLSHQGLAAYRHPLRQARSQLSCRHNARRCTLLDQIVSPDPRGWNLTLGAHVGRLG
jgi:transposase